MSDLKSRIEEIYRTAEDWGYATNRLVEIEIGLSLTPAERLRWLEEARETFMPAVELAQRLRQPR